MADNTPAETDELFDAVDLELAARVMYDTAWLREREPAWEDLPESEREEQRYIARAVLVAVASHGSPLVARIRRQMAEKAARAVEEYPGPDPSPANPAWWAGWVEGQGDAARIVREAGQQTGAGDG